ncbi:hypothetical protein [Acinetobacter sp. YH12219]|uniref:hypothetical protein n=1 Tax=Acinetobacter sp. YH12219 TaxID=2601153 RepID=UPI0015D285E4|nr:hypothetical protein [Acinetobacter sp. YH12219]
MKYSDEFIAFVATISGEAGVCSITSKKAVAHCIMNRLGFGEWVGHPSIIQYLYDDFDALTEQTAAVKKVKAEMNSNKVSKDTQDIIDAVYPIYMREEEDFTNGVVLYYSPKAQKFLNNKDPKNYKYPPNFVNELTEEVKINGTENDDMCWIRYKGTSRFFIKFIDQSAKKLMGSRVNVSYKKTKYIPTMSNLLIDEEGFIRSILVKGGWGARFSVDGSSVKDENNKELMLIADGKNHHVIIVVDNGMGGIKTRTDKHNQELPQNNKDGRGNTENSNNQENNSNKLDVKFDLRVLDSDGKPISRISYFLKYKGKEKKHSTENDGVEKGIQAESGEKIAVLVSGRDSKQEVGIFTVLNDKKIYDIQIKLHKFEIIFRHKKSGKSIKNLNLVQWYRGKEYPKKTNDEGKIIVNAMPGFDLNYKLRNGQNLLTIKVDKNKTIRFIDVDSQVLEQASKDLDLINAEKKSSKTKNTSQEQQTRDETPKRDQTQATSQDGHPKTAVNDNNEEAEFSVLTYDKKTDQLFSGGNYLIQYKGNKRNHSSGTHGLGKKTHKAIIGQNIKVITLESEKEIVHFNDVIRNGMKDIGLKIDKPTLEVSGSHWYNRFMFSTDLNDLAEPFCSNVKKFVNFLKSEGFTVRVNTTHRPDARGYLMYYSTMISRGNIDSNNVPPWEGVNIDWSHGGNKEKAKKAAIEMHALYQVGNNPIARPGRSNHNPAKALAVDMKISGIDGKTIKINGKKFIVNTLADLAPVGREFGVFWFGNSDKPHWSHDGR